MSSDRNVQKFVPFNGLGDLNPEFSEAALAITDPLDWGLMYTGRNVRVRVFIIIG